MKKLLLSLILFAPSIGFSQSVWLQKSVICGDHEESIQVLNEKYGEIPIWQGISNIETKVIFYLNTQTKSWTIIETNGKMACSISVGENIEVLNKVSGRLTPK